MAKDDYHILACRILVYLYACVKAGETPDMNEVSAEKLKINPKYWLYVIKNLQNEGYIRGVRMGNALGGAAFARFDDIEITPDGIEYLQENTMMKKATNFLKNLKEIIPGI